MTHKETIKSVLINLRITEALSKELRRLDINVSEVCRSALLKEITKKGIDEKFKRKAI
jgi:post-segregation antitoxin (ccd killing protein)